MLNKLDILSGLDEIRLCTGYLVDGKQARWPLSLDELERVRDEFAEVAVQQRSVWSVLVHYEAKVQGGEKKSIRKMP